MILYTRVMIAGMGVFRVTWRPLSTCGRRPSLAAVNITLEDVRSVPTVEPSTEMPTIRGMTTKPALPMVAIPKGYIV